MKAILTSLITGVAVGSVFALLKFPIPAPSNAAGIAGVVGIWLGLVFITWLWK
jgi:XapX domain-containing protein